MSTLRTTTATNLVSLGSTSNPGDTYFETTNNRIVVWSGSAWTLYNNDGTSAPFANASSVSLDGVDDHMTTDSSVLNFFTGGGAVSAWIRPSSVTASSSTASSFRSILSKGTVYINFCIDETGKPTIYFYDGSVRELNATSTVSTTDWMHVCYTWSTSGCAIYVNGTSEASTTSFTPANVTSSQTNAPVWLGRTNLNPNHFGGLIDEVSLFNAELSSSEVNELISAGTGGANDTPADIYSTSLSPVNWWRMGDYSVDTSGSTVTDQGSGSNNLTLQNGASFSSTVPTI